MVGQGYLRRRVCVTAGDVRHLRVCDRRHLSALSVDCVPLASPFAFVTYVILRLCDRGFSRETGFFSS